MENCCEERPNFGHPACIADLGSATRFIFVGLPNRYNLDTDLTYNAVLASFNDTGKDSWRPFPLIENFVWTPAESQFDEGSSGRKSFIKDGKISIECETWDGDATPKMVEKMKALRCANWGMFIVTSENKLIGSSNLNANNGIGQFLPIPVDTQSIEALFQLKTNDATQKIMFKFDLLRNFDVSTLYAIDGDAIWDDVNEVVVPVDFNDLPTVVDANLKVGSVAPTTTSIGFKVNDDYRQGTRIAPHDDLGNVQGLTIADFLVENVTDATTITPTSIVETLPGYYVITMPAQTAGDNIRVSIDPVPYTTLDSQNSIRYVGSMEVVVN